jgi:signal transduction histidine kinase
VAELARSVVAEQKSLADKKKVTLSVKVGADIPAIPADPKLLRIIMQNLLSNAIRYTAEKGEIDFGARLAKRGSFVDGRKIDEDSIAIVVSDTGYGIPKNQQGQIFTKLFRADNARERNTEGTGLGLYIVKSIIERSGGNIWFESEENKGTKFYVTLPAAGMKKREIARAPAPG